LESEKGLPRKSETELHSQLPPPRELLADRLAEAAGRQIIFEIEIVMVEQIEELEPYLKIEPATLVNRIMDRVDSAGSSLYRTC